MQEALASPDIASALLWLMLLLCQKVPPHPLQKAQKIFEGVKVVTLTRPINYTGYCRMNKGDKFLPDALRPLYHVEVLWANGQVPSPSLSGSFLVKRCQ